MKTPVTLIFMAVFTTSTGAGGQNISQAQTQEGWQACSALVADSVRRLACFDQWAQQQLPSAAPPPTAPFPRAGGEGLKLPTNAQPECKSSRYSQLSRFWELEKGSDCGAYTIRGYKPISLSWIGSDSVNHQPSSTNPSNTASSAVPYSNNETRAQLSVRTKMAQGLLTRFENERRDSLWFGYTQQSNWQLFTPELSRPFRTTDHEPEITYIYPSDVPLPLGWRLRYSGLSLVHQSNGQSLPLSRSWNRGVIMAGMEHGDQFVLQGKLWQRQNEDPSDDDNPGIENYVGRAELSGFWNVNKSNTLGLTLRHSLKSDANGSIRLDWFKAIGNGGTNPDNTGLRFHMQLFSGYGDSLVDYNRRRTVLSVGLSLVDW